MRNLNRILRRREGSKTCILQPSLEMRELAQVTENIDDCLREGRKKYSQGRTIFLELVRASHRSIASRPARIGR